MGNDKFTWSAVLIGLALWATASSAATLQIIPITGGQAGVDFFSPEFMDNQPVSYDAVTGPASAASDGFVQTTGQANRFGFIDFGVDYANVRIFETWSRKRPWPGAVPAGPGYAIVYWDDDTDTVNDGINESVLNFMTTAVPNNGDETWQRDVQLTTATAITPQARYLIVGTGPTGLSEAGKFTEIAVVGQIIPEPASLMLLTVGSALVLRRRG